MGGWGVSYPNFFWIFIYFLYLQGPLVKQFYIVHNHNLLLTSRGTRWGKIISVSDLELYEI